MRRSSTFALTPEKPAGILKLPSRRPRRTAIGGRSLPRFERLPRRREEWDRWRNDCDAAARVSIARYQARETRASRHLGQFLPNWGSGCPSIRLRTSHPRHGDQAPSDTRRPRAESRYSLISAGDCVRCSPHRAPSPFQRGTGLTLPYRQPPRRAVTRRYPDRCAT